MGLMEVMGYMNAEEAKAAGFSHHGKYYFLPIWMGDIDADDFDGGPLIGAKVSWLDWMLPVISVVENTLQLLTGSELGFNFRVMQPIAVEQQG
jgi:hypothetical protein